MRIPATSFWVLCLLLSGRFGLESFADETTVPEKAVIAPVITGTVFDYDGNPVAGALITGGDLPVIKSDEKGKFQIEIPGAPAFFLQLTAWQPGTDRVGFKNFPSFLNGIDKFPQLDIVLKRGHRFYGKVLDREGNPVSEAYVGANRPSIAIEPVLTDEEGKFEFFSISSKIDCIYAYKPELGFDFRSKNLPKSETTLFSTEEIGPFEFKLTKSEPVKVNIQNEKGIPLEGIRVGLAYVISKDGDTWASNADDSWLAREKKLLHTFTDADGNAVIDWVHENESYMFYAVQTPENAPESTERYGHLRFPPGENRKTVSAKLPRAVVVKGSAKLWDGSAVPYAYLISRIEVGNSWAYADGKGEFVFIVDQGTKLTVCVQSLKGAAEPVYIEAADADDPPRIDIVLEKGTLFQGRLYEEKDSETPIRNRRLDVYERNASVKEKLQEGYFDITRDITTDDEGNFATRLPPGEYFIDTSHTLGR